MTSSREPITLAVTPTPALTRDERNIEERGVESKAPMHVPADKKVKHLTVSLALALREEAKNACGGGTEAISVAV